MRNAYFTFSPPYGRWAKGGARGRVTEWYTKREIGGDKMEMRVYIANLGKYNEGELVGDWFTLPVELETVSDRLGLNAEYEEYAIYDYEFPIDLGEYLSIERLNHIAETIEELPEHMIDNIQELLTYFSDIDNLYENQEDIIYYPECKTMAEYAQYIIEESGVLNALPVDLRCYFNYEYYGRDLSLSGNYIETDSGIYRIR